MELNISLEHGPLTAEIKASEEEDYEEVLEDLAGFLEDHPSLINGSSLESTKETSSNVTESKNATEASLANFSDGDDLQLEYDEVEIENEMLRPILERVEIGEDEFMRTFEVHEDITPRILTPEDVPGESVGEKILNASLVLTTIWQDCYDEQWMKTSDLSTALEQSGMKDRVDYIYNQKNWKSLFNKEGKSRGTKLRITRLGKDKADDLIKKMV